MLHHIRQKKLHYIKAPMTARGQAVHTGFIIISPSLRLLQLLQQLGNWEYKLH
jgi:hypothetical protein